MQNFATTRRTAALLTPVGRGAVATIRVVDSLNLSTLPTPPVNHDSPTTKPDLSSLDELCRAANGLPLSHQPLRKIAFGEWGTKDFEELVICRLAADVLEIHCHGGDAAVRRVLDDLAAAGCDIVDWQSQVASAKDLLESECLEVLSRTTTWRTTEIVLRQANGLLRSAFVRLNHFKAAGNVTALKSALDELLQWSNFGRHLSTPWNVVLTGRPNVGKSSLINALLGYQRAIVFDEPGTTRDVVTGETAFEGWPVVLADTAGVRDDATDLEAAGIALARERLRMADLHLVLIDVSQTPTIDDFQLLSQWPDAIVVAHKSDLPDQWNSSLPIHAIRVSSVSGEGLTKLQKAIVNRLIPDVPKSDTAIPLTPRHGNQLFEIRRSLTATSPPGGPQTTEFS